MDTLARIKELAAKQFGGEPDTIDENAPVDKLGIDSLGFLEFLFELEDKFGFSIPQEAVANVKTLRELATAIDGIIAAQGGEGGGAGDGTDTAKSAGAAPAQPPAAN